MQIQLFLNPLIHQLRQRLDPVLIYILMQYLKSFVSELTSLWFTIANLCLCKYSMGSSTVTICTFCSLFILSIIAANVVDLPLPVGPVTNINPLGSTNVSVTGADLIH